MPWRGVVRRTRNACAVLEPCGRRGACIGDYCRLLLSTKRVKQHPDYFQESLSFSLNLFHRAAQVFDALGNKLCGFGFRPWPVLALHHMRSRVAHG